MFYAKLAGSDAYKDVCISALAGLLTTLLFACLGGQQHIFGPLASGHSEPRIQLRCIQA